MRWADTHHPAAKIHLEEHVALSILRGDVKDTLKVHLGSVFTPHSLGHLLGLDVHDVCVWGGYPEVRRGYLIF